MRDIDKIPFFSIIIPVFNRKEKISIAIQSVLDQSFNNWELLVIDDNSSDNTSEVIKSFKDPRISYFKNNKNFGAAYSRNRGIEKAKGEIISFLDSDDQFFPDFLTKTFLFFQNKSRDIGFCWTGLKVKYTSKTKEEIWNPKIKNSAYYSFLKELRIGSGCGISILKEVFSKCGMFNEELSAAEDTDFFLRIVQEFDFGVIDEILVFIDKSGKDRLSLNYHNNAESYNKFIHQHWPMINKYPELQRKYFYKLMWLNYHLGNKKNAREYFIQFYKFLGLSSKVIFVFLIFELFGRKFGSKIHIYLSS